MSRQSLSHEIWNCFLNKPEVKRLDVLLSSLIIDKVGGVHLSIFVYRIGYCVEFISCYKIGDLHACVSLMQDQMFLMHKAIVSLIIRYQLYSRIYFYHNSVLLFFIGFDIDIDWT